MGLAFLAAVVATVIAAAIWFHWRQAEPEVRESAPPGGVTLAPGPTTTLAVLPFANPTGGPTAECLCEGIPELIIRTLSRIASVSVIARKSSFEFRGTTADIEAVREKLGASHVIQGSLKKRNDAVEIEAGVLDAATGTALWKGRRQGPMAEAVAVPYEISAGVVNALKVPLTADERNRLNDRSAGTTNSSAYVRYLEGLSYAHRNDRETNARARSLFEEAVALDPKYAEAYAALAQTHLLDLRYGWTKFPGLTLGKSMEMTRKALELNDSVTRAHLNMALIHLAKHEHDRAIAEAQKAVALSPNDADALANLGMILVYAGKPDVAVQPVSRAMQLNPAAPNLYCQILGDAYTGMKRYEDAIETYQKGLRSWTVSPALRVRLIAAYSLAGKREEARAAAAELLRTSQRFSLAPLLGRMPFKRAADAARIRDALRDAGVE
jgi:adenylate cyclase